jgi:adenosylcobinamide kinase / adenosylcobinamide-phosphate guanylyltransferase
MTVPAGGGNRGEPERLSGRVLVLGGNRSGKSRFAESLLGGAPAVDYVATAAARPGDEEWTQRIDRHRARRPATWRTIETAAVAQHLVEPGPPVLVDSVTAWLARTMDECGCWSDGPGDSAIEALAEQQDRLCDGWIGAARTAVLVSDEVGSGVVPATASGRRFRDELGLLNQRLAAGADRVYLVTAGIAQRLR